MMSTKGLMATSKIKDAFYEQWQHQALVVNQWLKVQACCHLPGTLDRVKALNEINPQIASRILAQSPMIN